MLLSRSELESLTKTYDQWHVSIYMPTHRAGDEIQQDPIRLRNLLDEAEESLLAGGLRRLEARELLDPARGLVEDEIFWQHQRDGLALFLASELFREYRLPSEFEELAVVGERFHIKPLLPILSNNGRFYLLALSQDGLKLFQGTRYNIGELGLEEVPQSLIEVLRWDDPEKRLQLHTGSEAVTDGAEAIFHGHGVASEDDPKNYIRRYFHRVDEGVSDLLADERAPLVLAGVDYLLPIYEEANSYPHLIEDQGVEGSPNELAVEELHERAWSIVQPLFAEAQENAAAQYRMLSGRGSELASSDIEEVVPAAYYERVETLFVALGERRWGSFDPDTGQVELHGEPASGDGASPERGRGDLLDFAAAHTLLNDGTVYAVEPQEVPSDTLLAAVFRF